MAFIDIEDLSKSLNIFFQFIWDDKPVGQGSYRILFIILILLGKYG